MKSGPWLPGAGLWRQSFPVSGCGNDTTVNFYFLAEAGQKISVIIGMPGGTMASLPLQSAGRKFTTLAVQRAAPTCRAFDVINTRFERLEPPKPGDADRAWRESWTLAGCGHRYTVPIEFTPNKTGAEVTLPEGVIAER